jgi:hypothetical protein
MPRSIYHKSNGDKTIYHKTPATGSGCPVIDESAAMEALEALLLSFEDVIKHYPPGTFIAPNLGRLDVAYSISPVLFVRLHWAGIYKTKFTGSKEQTYDLLHTYISLGVDWHKDPMLVKLVAGHQITVS